MSSPKQTIAFFGATGGTGATCLSKALKEGHHCTALVRTPDKLRNLLTTAYKLDAHTLTYLTIHQGNAKHAADVAKALVSPVDDKLLVDTIWTSIGAYPRFQWSITMPLILTDPTICEDGMAAMFAAIDQLADRGVKVGQKGEKPLLIAISSTGSDNLWDSVPWVYIPFYAWLLHSPHVDKLNMEKLVKADDGRHIRSFVIVRPSILTDGAERGIEKIRTGWVWGGGDKAGREKETGYAIGYTVGKKDLGMWVYKKIIVDGGWEGRCVSLCY